MTLRHLLSGKCGRRLLRYRLVEAENSPMQGGAVGKPRYLPPAALCHHCQRRKAPKDYQRGDIIDLTGVASMREGIIRAACCADCSTFSRWNTGRQVREGECTMVAA